MVFKSRGVEGSAPETNSPPQLSDSLCCKNNRQITHPTCAKYEGECKFTLHSLEKKSLRGGLGADLHFAKRGHIITSDFSSSS